MLKRKRHYGILFMKTFYNVVNAIICCAKEGRAVITGNPGSLLVSGSDFITWLNTA